MRHLQRPQHPKFRVSTRLGILDITRAMSRILVARAAHANYQQAAVGAPVLPTQPITGEQVRAPMSSDANGWDGTCG